METGRRTALRLVVGASIASTLAGCLGGDSGDDGRNGSDDDSRDGSSPGSTGGSNEAFDGDALGVVVAESVDHTYACNRVTEGAPSALDASASAADAPTIAETGTVWDVSHDGYGYVAFDAEARGHPGPFVFYVTEGAIDAVSGAETDRGTVGDDSCGRLRSYVAVTPDDGRIILGVGDDPDVEIEHPDEYPDGVDESDGGETGHTDENGYETYAVRDVEVPLAPVEDVAHWYEDDDELVVLDTRSAVPYGNLRISGAQLSPAPDGHSAHAGLIGVPSATRIVTYCVCPHTLAGHRAAALIEAGYTEVYALNEGLEEWVDRGYPIAGSEVP
ncbi:rhodanese-like domain-containing protein [Halobacteria archaeon AArc-dxtr1]|nr:rhodanese-like domain-containing protein [Halobacteria archaeon AArc-dxtr1]